MSITLKKDQWKVKDPSTGTYRGSAIFSTTLPEDAEQIVEDASDALDVQQVRAQEIVNNAQNAVNGINGLRETMIASIASVAGQGTDTTLTTPGVAADAATCGDLKNTLILKQFVSGTNLFDKNSSELVPGSFFGNTGYIYTGSETYGITGFIPVTGGQKYTYKSRSGGTYNCWYTIDKQFISAWSNNEGHPYTETAPNNAYYIRVTYGIAEINATQLNESETILPYEAYKEYPVSNELRKMIPVDPGDLATKEEIEDIYDELDEKVDKTILSLNLFDKNADGIISNSFLSTNASIVGGVDSYSISDYIPVKPGQKYCYKSRAGGALNWYYDNTKTYIPSSSGGSFSCDDMPVVSTAPTDAAFVRLSFGNAEKDITMFVEGETIPSYQPYAEIDVNEQIRKVYFTDFNELGVAPLKIESALGKTGVVTKTASLSANTALQNTNFPYHLKKNVAISFSAKFSTFSGLILGKGYMEYKGSWIVIDGTNVVLHHYDWDQDNTLSTKAHGLTIQDYLMVSMFYDKDCHLHVTLDTNGGGASLYFDSNNNKNGFNNALYAKSETALTDVVLSASCKDVQSGLWFMGDSYLSISNERVLGQLINMGFYEGMLFDALPGINSYNLSVELERLLQFGIPQHLVWYSGMNDSALINYTNAYTAVKALCDQYGIELILNKIPTVPNISREDIDNYIVNTGLRYIDSYAAVGANSSGVWYTGYLSSDNIHPTEIGAKALAARCVVDVPELMMYGYTEVT